MSRPSVMISARAARWPSLSNSARRAATSDRSRGTRSRAHAGFSPRSISSLYESTPGRSTSIQGSDESRGMRYGRASRPAARLTTRSAPCLSCSAISWSYRKVRITQAHSFRSLAGSAAKICSPRSPASRRANGSRNRAPGRPLSRARYTAAQCAVSETFRMTGSFWLIGCPPRCPAIREECGAGRDCCAPSARPGSGPGEGPRAAAAPARGWRRSRTRRGRRSRS